MASRGFLISPVEETREISRSEKVSRTLESCFADDEENQLTLSDEISAGRLSYLVAESRAFLSAENLTPSHWVALGEFLAEEFSELKLLKSRVNKAQLECAKWLKVAEEVCDPANEVGPNRVLEVALALQGAKMRRDHIRDRVQMILDELSAEILAGLSPENRDSREIRLRGVMGKLG